MPPGAIPKPSAGHSHLYGPSTNLCFTSTTALKHMLNYYTSSTLQNKKNNASQVLAGQFGPPKQALAGHNFWLGGPFLARGPLFEKHWLKGYVGRGHGTMRATWPKSECLRLLILSRTREKPVQRVSSTFSTMVKQENSTEHSPLAQHSI